MITNKTKITYSGMNKDISKSKYSGNLYYDANNIKLTPVEGQAFGSVSNSYGNKLVLKLPNILIDIPAKTITAGTQVIHYTNTEIDSLPATSGLQIIIGDINTKNGFILFSTDNNGVDCIWEVKDAEENPLNYSLLYVRNMNFSTSRPIQAVFNYENLKIQKIFWIDGTQYLRYLNISQSILNGYKSELINLPVSSVNSRSTFDISQPTVLSAGGGGTHTSGVIQYGYTLYNLNGSETSISPLSRLFPLGKGSGLGGGDLNEVVGSMPVVQIENIDRKYSFIKLYSVKYTVFNGTPAISLIYDGGIGDFTKFTFNDTGATLIKELGLAQFLFLGADAIKPTHIATKKNTLFVANNKTTAYKLDIDTRAYSFNKEGTSAKIFSNVTYTGTGDIPYTGDLLDVKDGFDTIPDTFDSINLDFDTFRYRNNTIILPATTILNKASYVRATKALGGLDLFTNSVENLTKSITATCNINNISSNFTYIDIATPASALTSNNKINIVDSSAYSFSLRAVYVRETVASEVSPSSIEVEAVVTSITGTETIIEFSRMNNGATDRAIIEDNFSLEVSLIAGDSVRFRIKYGYHYNNNYCNWGAINQPNNNKQFLDDFNPYLNAVSPKTVTSSFTVSDFTGKKGVILNSADILPIIPVNGETIVSNGVVNFNFSGTSTVTIDSAVVVKNSIPSNPTLFSVGILKNGIKVTSIPLNLNSVGTITSSTDIQLNVLPNDKLSLVLLFEDPAHPFKSSTWDLEISGEISITKTTESNNTGEGGVGKYISYELYKSSDSEVDTKIDKFFKDNEIYRIGILFRNTLGQLTEAKWIADFKAPSGNLYKQYNTLKVNLTDAFYSYISTLPEEERPASYTILRAYRGARDKTIITQGILTGMMVQGRTKKITDFDSFTERKAANKGLIKLPVIMTRGFKAGISGKNNSYFPIIPTSHNESMNGRNRPNYVPWADSRALQGIRGEIYSDVEYDDVKDSIYQMSWQFTKLMQLHSPEAAFHLPINTTSTDKLVVLGFMHRDMFELVEQETNEDTKVISRTTKRSFTNGTVGGFLPYLPGGFDVIGPSYVYWTRKRQTGEENNTKETRQLHTHKTFTELVKAEKSYDIYGTPEVTEVGQAATYYNKDFALRYANRLQSVISDYKGRHRKGQKLANVQGIEGIDSEGNRCITIALGGSNLDAEDRPGLESLWANTGASSLDWDSEVFAEIRKSNEFIYSGSLYGGYDIYARANTEYIPMGSTTLISNSTTYVKSPGDTFVQLYKNTRLTKAPGTVYSISRQIVCETLEYMVETTVNLDKRNDISIGPWGRTVDPVNKEANTYNRVYSTDNSIVTYKTDNLKLNLVKQLDTQVMASKPKLPGEFIESWVDFLPNEVQYLDGKFGSINALISHKDELYAFQDSGIAKLSISPRVQIGAGDGVGLELGTGKKLHDYNYLSTNIGSINKWGIVSTNSGLYFIDSTTKQLYRINETVEDISSQKGLHSFFNTNLNKLNLSNDNPLEEKGVIAGTDFTNGDIYMTVMNSSTDKYTIIFNEKVNSFTSFCSFTPSRYIVKGDKMFTTSPNNNEIWLHYDGEYQTYYGTKYTSDITLLVNTKDNKEKVFNNIEYDTEVTLNSIDVPNITLNKMLAWNDYQTSDNIPLIAKRKIRTWRASIPREKASRNRLRDKWLFMKLGFNFKENYKLVLHDMTVSFTQIN